MKAPILPTLSGNSPDQIRQWAQDLVNALVYELSNITAGAVTNTTYIGPGIIGTTELEDLSVTTGKVALVAIDTAQLANAAITTGKIADANVSTDKLASLAVTAAKLAGATTGAQITVTDITAGHCTTTNTQGLANGDYVRFGSGGTTAGGYYLVSQLVINTSFHIDDATITDATDVTCYEATEGAITNEKIANLAVGHTAIAAAAIGTAHIANLAVTTALIADLSVVAAKIGSLAVEEAKINSLAVTEAKIGNLAVTAAKIASATITNAQIANATITGAQIAGATITSAHIANATIGAAEIALATITHAQIADATITGAKIANATITAANIANATITNAQIANATITGANIANATIGAAQIALATITDAQIASLNADKINAGTINAASIAVTNLSATNIVSGSLKNGRMRRYNRRAFGGIDAQMAEEFTGPHSWTHRFYLCGANAETRLVNNLSEAMAFYCGVYKAATAGTASGRILIEDLQNSVNYESSYLQISQGSSGWIDANVTFTLPVSNNLRISMQSTSVGTSDNSCVRLNTAIDWGIDYA